jgi:hypothetical protein
VTARNVNEDRLIGIPVCLFFFMQNYMDLLMYRSCYQFGYPPFCFISIHVFVRFALYHAFVDREQMQHTHLLFTALLHIVYFLMQIGISLYTQFFWKHSPSNHAASFVYFFLPSVCKEFNPFLQVHLALRDMIKSYFTFIQIIHCFVPTAALMLSSQRCNLHICLRKIIWHFWESVENVPVSFIAGDWN